MDSVRMTSAGKSCDAISRPAACAGSWGKKIILKPEPSPIKRLFLMNFGMFREKLCRLYICLRKQWNEGYSGSFDRRLECVSCLYENLMALIYKDSG
jgi:hypothetical protein